MISPAPEQPVRILVGGHSDIAMARAARHDGWISANCTEAELGELVPPPTASPRRRAAGARRASRSTPWPSTCSTPTASGASRTLGVTECQVVPWFFYGGDPTDLGVQVDSLARFADTVLAHMED